MGVSDILKWKTPRNTEQNSANTVCMYLLIMYALCKILLQHMLIKKRIIIFQTSEDDQQVEYLMDSI